MEHFRRILLLLTLVLVASLPVAVDRSGAEMISTSFQWSAKDYCSLPLFRNTRICKEAPPPPPPQQGCLCTKIYKPVCGADGNTYGNSCEAACAGVKIVKDSPCRNVPVL